MEEGLFQSKEENYSKDYQMNVEKGMFEVKEEVMDFTIENPWIVPSLDKFLFFCCPECENKSSNKSSFVNHAISQHPLVSFFLLLFKQIHPPIFYFYFLEDGQFKISKSRYWNLCLDTFNCSKLLKSISFRLE